MVADTLWRFNPPDQPTSAEDLFQSLDSMEKWKGDAVEAFNCVLASMRVNRRYKAMSINGGLSTRIAADTRIFFFLTLEHPDGADPAGRTSGSGSYCASGLGTW